MNCSHSSGYGLHCFGHRRGTVIQGGLTGSGRSLDYNNWVSWLGSGDMERYIRVEDIDMKILGFDIFLCNHEFGKAGSDMKRIVLHQNKSSE